MALVRSVYLLTASLPPDERFGLTSQMRLSAVSVPSNIAEGHGRLSDRMLRTFLGTARGSLFELETQLLLAADMQFARLEDVDVVLNQTAEVARILNGLLKTLEVEQER
ncbi:MAG: four helix bundle protein [Terriglobus roseus]|nr:four helix bundle protein [Terriglobus roseus]